VESSRGCCFFTELARLTKSTFLTRAQFKHGTFSVSDQVARRQAQGALGSGLIGRKQRGRSGGQ